MYGRPFFQKFALPDVLDPVVRVVAEHPVRAGADRVPGDVDLVVEPLGHDRRVALPGEEAEDAGVGLLQVQDERRTSRRPGRCRSPAPGATVEMLPGSGGLSIFSTEYLTSAAVTSLPLWNLTPCFSVQRIAVLLTISNFSASAGLTFRFRSHSTSESYANSLPQWFAVRIPPNGATCAGSCSSAQIEPAAPLDRRRRRVRFGRRLRRARERRPPQRRLHRPRPPSPAARGGRARRRPGYRT